jgi:hypothetical protein
MPAGDVFGLDGFFLNVSNPITVSAVDINSTAVGAGITVVSGVLNAAAGIATLTLSTAAGLTTTPFYTGAKIAVSGLSTAGVAYTGYNGNFVVTGFAGTTTVSYATTGYVGGVTASISGQTGLVMLVTDTAVTNTTWTSAQTHGWFGGGGLPSSSRVDRIDFSNDTGTANIRNPLSAARGYLAATGNSNYGWFGGGQPSGSTVERIDFSNDATTASSRSPLSVSRTATSATGNSNYGWFGGGATPTAVVSTVDRIDFSNDSSTALPRGPLTLARSRLEATGNSNYGWFGGGFPGPGPLSRVDRIDFSNDSSTASVRGTLSSERYYLAATGNSNYGWFGGGAPAPVLSTVDRIDFSNDSATVSPRGPLSSARGYLAATGNSNYGWFGGGIFASIVDRIDFSNDSSTASPRGPLSFGRGGLAATSGQARSSSTRLQKAGNFGWFGGGFATTGSGGGRSTIDRIDFSNDLAAASPRGTLNSPSTGKYFLAATGNSNFGWFGGGYTPTTPSAGNTRVSTVDRIDFSNDSPRASIRGPLTSIRQSLSATGNSNYGWFGGGDYTGVSTVDRIDFSNDSATASPRGPLSLARGQLAATGNSNYGWFGGGYIQPFTPANYYSRIDRIDFSNDSSTASVRGPLSADRKAHAATGNFNYGWFGGGTSISVPGNTSTVERIDFSNDSSTASPRNPLSSARYGIAATGNSNYGWFGGGHSNGPFPSPTFSTVDRINFSNDLTSVSIRSPLSNSRCQHLAATSNTPVG